MANELQPTRGFDGRIEKFGASQKINDELLANFQIRGRQAASLLVATLTETPYAPELDGQVFSIEVSNRYQGHGAVGGEGEDTVTQAVEALQEFTTAKVPGAKKVGLSTFRTNYGAMLDDLAPSRRTPQDQKQAFQQALVEGANLRGVSIARYEQGLEIIGGAPRKVKGLLMSDRDRAYHSRLGTQNHNLVTENGRVLRVSSTGHIGFFWRLRLLGATK